MDNGTKPPVETIDQDTLKKLNVLKTRMGNYQKAEAEAKEKIELTTVALDSIIESLLSKHGLDRDKDKIDWSNGKITRFVEPVKTIRNNEVKEAAEAAAVTE